ncbi:MAG: hypothetical protein IPH65_10190 [Dehalococcoidia bacterium]|uniref:hypothetical protein n=1 Tax=Candidatus Amarobacter glycogenicus TaxID=3140699 RepID=UPI00313552D2|nr:hypothetical protein [Dehalococcoidia bacterium]
MSFGNWQSGSDGGRERVTAGGVVQRATGANQTRGVGLLNPALGGGGEVADLVADPGWAVVQARPLDHDFWGLSRGGDGFVLRVAGACGRQQGECSKHSRTGKTTHQRHHMQSS